MSTFLPSIRPATGRRCRQAGFTVIEVVTAVFILAVLMAMVGRIFTGSAQAMNQGTGLSEANSQARATISFMKRELSNMLFDRTPQRFKLDVSSDNTSILFDSLNNDVKDGGATSDLAWQRIEYAYDETENRITRELFNVSSGSGGGAQVLMENCFGLEFRVYSAQETERRALPITTGVPPPNNRYPLYVDFYFEVLGPKDAAAAKLMSGAERDDFLARRTRPYFSRIFLNNHDGYLEGYNNK